MFFQCHSVRWDGWMLFITPTVEPLKRECETAATFATSLLSRTTRTASAIAKQVCCDQRNQCTAVEWQLEKWRKLPQNKQQDMQIKKKWKNPLFGIESSCSFILRFFYIHFLWLIYTTPLHGCVRSTRIHNSLASSSVESCRQFTNLSPFATDGILTFPSNLAPSSESTVEKERKETKFAKRERTAENKNL